MFITSALVSFCPPFSVLPPHHLRCPPNIMPSDLNPPPPRCPPAFLPADVRLQMNYCVCMCLCVSVCVFSCVLKGSGWVARTIGPPTAYCSEALSGEFPSKHHGKTIKTTSKSLLLSFTFFLLFVLLLLLLPLSLYLSPFRRSTLTRPSFHTSRGKVLTLAAGCGRSQSPC